MLLRRLALFLCLTCATACSMHSSFYDPAKLVPLTESESRALRARMDSRKAAFTSGRILYQIDGNGRTMRAAAVFDVRAESLRLEIFPASLAISSQLLVKSGDRITVVDQMKRSRTETGDMGTATSEVLGFPVERDDLHTLFTASASSAACERLERIDAGRVACRGNARILIVSEYSGQVLSIERFGSLGQQRWRSVFGAQSTQSQPTVPETTYIDIPRYGVHVELTVGSISLNGTIPASLFTIR